MKRNVFAILTALACALPAIPAQIVSASSSTDMTEYVVTDTFHNDEGVLSKLIVREIGTTATLQLSSCGADLTAALEGQDEPEYGDILRVSEPDMIAEIYPGCMHYIPEKPLIIVNLGHVSEIAQKKLLTLESKESWHSVLCDANGSQYDYYEETRFNLPKIELAEGESDLFYVYNSNVVLPVADENESDTNWQTIVNAIIVNDSLVMYDNNQPVYFSQKEDSNGHPLAIGDAVRIETKGIYETYPGKFIPDFHVEYLGKASECYGMDTFTVTEKTEYRLNMTNASGKAAAYTYDYSWSFDLPLYNAEIAANANVGDQLTFILGANGTPAIPCEAPKKAFTGNAAEAALVLIKAAQLGAGETAAPEELALMDVNADDRISAIDASIVLCYAANAGTSADYPEFSEYIAQRLEEPEYDGAQYVSMILADIYTAFSNGEYGYDPISFLITSPEELEAFVEKMHEVGERFDTRTSTDALGEWGVPLTDTVAKYDAAWFREHDLIMVIAIEQATQDYHAVRGISKNEDGSWTVNIDRIVPMASEQTIPSFAIFVETNKAVEFASSVNVEMTNVYIEK